MIHLKYKDCLQTYTKTCCLQILCQVSNFSYFRPAVLNLFSFFTPFWKIIPNLPPIYKIVFNLRKSNRFFEL